MQVSNSVLKGLGLGLVGSGLVNIPFPHPCKDHLIVASTLQYIYLFDSIYPWMHLNNIACQVFCQLVL